jgi:hypothetical protein
MRVVVLICAAGILLPHDVAGFAIRSKAASANLDPAAQAKVQAAYARLPLAFEANQGQADKKVKFLSRSSAYSLFLSSTEAVFQWRHGGFRKAATSLARAKRTESIPKKQQEGSPTEIESPEWVTLSLKLAGANQAPQMEGLDQLRGKSHYFTVNNARQWHAAVPTYAKVRYRSVYPGIDVVYYGNQQQLEYDFIVAPGGDPKRIILSFDEATKTRGGVRLRLDDNGDLLVRTGEVELRQLKPVVYQEFDGIKRTIAGRYVLKGHRQAGFELGDYDRSKPLVVDPVIFYFSIGEGGGGIAIDPVGNAYLTGTSGSRNAFVVKLNPSATEVLYATYLGGSGSDSGADIAIDEAGNIYLTGQTSSADFPTTPGAFQTTYFGGTCKNIGVTRTTRPCEDLFIAKLNPTGTELIYSTYLGGSSSEYASGIALDSLGNAHVTGATRSTNFPTTQGSFQIIPGSAACSDAELCTGDAFVVKLNSSGTELLYSTYLGGAGSDWCAGIAVDSVGNAHVAGDTFSDDFPTSPGALQVGNSFVSKLNATGTAMLYSTRFGSALDAAQTYSVGGMITAIALDLDGNAYVTGFTSSSDFPTTPGAFQSVCNSNGSNYFDLADAFVTKLNATGTEIVYSTCLGGRNFEDGVAISVDLAGNAYVAGRTSSADFPTTPGAVQAGSEVETWGGAFVAKLNAAGSALVYSTYLGDQLWASDIAVDSVGDAYVTGARSDSTGSHPFVTKLHDDLSALAPLVSPTPAERQARQETFRGLKTHLQMSK